MPDRVEHHSERPKRRSSWRSKFSVAFRGLRVGAQGQSSFCVHLFFAVLAIAALIVLKCQPLEWCLIIGCIGFVFTTELINSSIELLFCGFDQPTRDRVYPCLDIAAGAVLIASTTAVLIGLIVFGQRISGVLLLIL